MGREVKRVPLDFDWPMDTRWKGFLNPNYTAIKCESCDATGYSPVAANLHKQWYGNAPFKPEDRGSVPFTPDDPYIRETVGWKVDRDESRFYYHQVPVSVRRGFFMEFAETKWREAAIDIEAARMCRIYNGSWNHHLNDDDVAALIKSGRPHDFTHVFVAGEGWKPKEPPVVPTAADVNKWSLAGFGHDSINCWVVIKAECERLGVPSTCPHCGGEGCIWPSEEAKAKYEAWEKEEPPTGEGWQVWETVTEGSPISPVFATPEALARHMATTRWGADKGTSYESWMAFIKEGWAPSMVLHRGEVKSGVEFIGATTGESAEEPELET